ncbi:MAG: FHA domain-containing protein [Lachnospiraceae bacterium]|nr:FHA domain-containing protein [Lachnospiraceae bacterium]
MSNYTAKRCVRPQCMEIYSEKYGGKYCDCGALLQLTQIEAPVRKVYKGIKEPVQRPPAYLYLMLDDGQEVEYKLGKTVLIGRKSDTVCVDIDLSEYRGLVSRRHAQISREEDGYYMTRLSENHSVHINGKPLASGEKRKLQSEDVVVLSKKILFQFEEGE